MVFRLREWAGSLFGVEVGSLEVCWDSGLCRYTATQLCLCIGFWILGQDLDARSLDWMV